MGLAAAISRQDGSDAAGGGRNRSTASRTARSRPSTRATGRVFWTFHYAVPPESNQYVLVVKGLAISGDSLFWATYDGHLISIDAKTGIANWNKTLVDWHKGYQLNVAPLVVKDKVILGPATNEEGANCWVAAYDVKTGNEALAVLHGADVGRRTDRQDMGR